MDPYCKIRIFGVGWAVGTAAPFNTSTIGILLESAPMKTSATPEKRSEAEREREREREDCKF